LREAHLTNGQSVHPTDPGTGAHLESGAMTPFLKMKQP
jgi:hypothetical protein